MKTALQYLCASLLVLATACTLQDDAVFGQACSAPTDCPLAYSCHVGACVKSNLLDAIVIDHSVSLDASVHADSVANEAHSNDGFTRDAGTDATLPDVLAVDTYDGGVGDVTLPDLQLPDAVTQTDAGVTVMTGSQIDSLFGYALAVSSTHVAIGAPNEGNGVVYLYKLQNGQVEFEMALQASLEAQGFGNSVALGDNAVLIGASKTNQYAGQVLLYTYHEPNWNLDHTFWAPTSAEGELFGEQVQLSSDGGLGVIAAPGEEIGSASTGRVYVYKKQAQIWLEPQVLDATASVCMENFGAELALNADASLLAIACPNKSTLTQTASGAVDIYRNPGDVTLIREHVIVQTVDANWYGLSLSFLGSDELLIGESGDYNETIDPGRVWIYRMSTSQVSEVVGAQTASTWFGRSIANTNTKILVGDCAGLAESSRGHIAYFIETGDWSEQTLDIADVEDNAHLGWRVAMTLDGFYAIVSAPLDRQRHGAVYVLPLR